MIDLDIKAFFDTIDHVLLLTAVRHHTDCRWVLLYVERWLKAPMQTVDGSIEPRTMGTPQGGVISPLLANLFLHYVFDAWMGRELPHIPFERYADDIICHVRTRREAVAMFDKLKARFAGCGLALSPQKTKIVYCQDTNRPGNGHPVTSFDFLGFTFRGLQFVKITLRFSAWWSSALTTLMLASTTATLRRATTRIHPDPWRKFANWPTRCILASHKPAVQASAQSGQ